MKTTAFYLSILGCFLTNILFAQDGEHIDGLVKGQLDNGLTYYIMKSHLQDDEASFYLVQKAGAILEDDDQNGLAHFLEHMAFNGSKHFPNGVDKYLKSQGVRKYNAYTAYDETVYNIDNVDTDNQALVDTCIYLLRDWCGDLLLTKEEIDKERGVIQEEWRSRLNVGKRRQEVVAPYVFYNTKYAERDVIGDMDIINNFKPKTLRSFYDKWYRADMQGVIIVGDIDVEDIEKKVKAVFGDLEVNPNAPALPEKIHMVANEEPFYVVFKDKEINRNTIKLFSRFEQSQFDDYNEVRKEQKLIEYFSELAYDRLVEFVNADQEKFFTADMGTTKLLGDFYAHSISVTPFPGKDKEALEQVLTIFEQIKRFGFTEEEVEKQKEKMFEKLEAASSNTDNFSNSIYVNKFKANFFNQVPISDIEDGIDNIMEVTLEIEAEEINEWAKNIDFRKDLLIEINANEKEENILSENEVLATMQKVENADLNEKQEIEQIDQLVDFELAEGSIDKIEKLEQFDAEAWTLSNGVRVIYKYSEEGKGDFDLYSQSNGGKSVLKSKEIPSANALIKMATKSGLYKYDRNTMMAYITDKKIRISLTFDELTEGLKGGANEEDADVLFQFVHLFLTHPRFNEEDFNAYKQKLQYKFNQQSNPMDAITEAITEVTSKPNDRTWKLGDEYFEAMDFETMKEIFTKAFGDAGDFTYYLVGDLDKEMAKGLVQKYIATLPSDPNKEADEFKEYDFSVPDKVIKKQFEVKMPESRGIIDISYLNDFDLSEKETVQLNTLIYTLRNRYFKTVREEYGGTYGVKVKPITSSYPKNKQQVSINFQTDADRVDELKPLIYQEIENVKKEGIYSFELNEAVNLMKRAQEQSQKHKGVPYWMNILISYEQRGLDLTSTEEMDKALNEVTVEGVQEFAKKFFDAAKLRDIVIIQRAPQVEEAHHHMQAR
ncbi:insulinase family protein [Echinicola sp. CAU 1574]|uniref:Insulinase family protein n=1 Tax=Echinicola arenosa TaxID=2774144 RepID=A0ABR9AJQ4_9BACT|nr:M16 family metallopeptidase [Echinicola arenosa]MBD8489060.1 insulinase family protein [Echinicola arenosa]